MKRFVAMVPLLLVMACASNPPEPPKPVAVAPAKPVTPEPPKPAAPEPPKPVAADPPKTQNLSFANDMVGTKWIAVTDGKLQGAAAPRIEFGPVGRMFGYTGCNSFGGQWSSEGAQVRLANIAATKRGCDGPAAEVEKRVLAALGDGSRAERHGDRLVLTGSQGATFEFVRRP